MGKCISFFDIQTKTRSGEEPPILTGKLSEPNTKASNLKALSSALPRSVSDVVLYVCK